MSSEISQLSVTYGVIGDFTTGDGVKRPVRQRVFSGEKLQTPGVLTICQNKPVGMSVE